MPNKKISILIFVFLIIFFKADYSSAKEDYPRLASYYLKYFDKSDYEELYKWDLIIMPTEMVFYNKPFFEEYKKRNKDGLLISYVYPAMINDRGLSESAGLKSYLYNAVDDNDWWLRDGHNEKMEIWPNLYAVNVAKDGWQNFNADYVKNKINLSQWDGIMYDTVDSTINHYDKKSCGIDIDGDNGKEDSGSVNKQWQDGMARLFEKTKNVVGNKIIMINGNSLASYQPKINGRMFETFPTPWEGNGSWAATMFQYLVNLPGKNIKPNVYVINSNTNNKWVMDNYRKMRFGLGSTLLGDGYYSFDYGDQNHAQTWWYDEYDAKLGKAKSKAYNLSDKNNSTVKAGLWRRDFEYGITVVNSTDKTQKYVFNKEEFEKINGTQDRRTNDGSKINWLNIEPNDGIVLYKINTEIINEGYDNGSFVRSFNDKGTQARNGFFAYKDAYPGNVQIMASDLNNDGEMETIVNGNGTITVYGKGAKKFSFMPYGEKFKGDISFAIGDLNNDKNKEIITGPAGSGGPQIKIFSATGKMLGAGFFAFDKNSRKGVSVAMGDIDNDGKDEIIAGTGKGQNPMVRIFRSDGRKIGEFIAYGSNLNASLSVAAGDINNDGKTEIITGPGEGASPNIRIFRTDGKLLGQFFAYDKSIKTGIKVMIGDTNNDKKDEILVSTTNLNTKY